MLDRALSRLATAARLGHGRHPGTALGPRPAAPLILFVFEACPMCRRVREAVTDLALPVELRPCPRGGTRFRPEAEALAGKMQFPFLVDPNTGTQLLESLDIVRYLYATYGTGAPPRWLLGPGFVATSQLASLARPRTLRRAAAGRLPTRLLRLTGGEADPGTRRVREALERVELPVRWEPGPLCLIDDDAEVAVEDPDAIEAHLERYAT